ncbi:KEOPS complex subunit Pcc1 [Methanobrevibacter cuticularis]|uniref:KEOPS complex subunit Pcc1 n=1 Tax=Methanobrevibacter cuticularis TaxID=47311 RepID=UPI002481580E|nr:KEOPS complex subunit Pcc1 [Methanobrevibacter cuticularis]
MNLDFEDIKQAEIVYKSVLLEFKTSPEHRSKMDIVLKDSCITISIDSNDATSFRASINSAIKWIILSVEVNNITL